MDPADLPDPDLALRAMDRAFVVSLEVRASAVTERADVVLPVAPPAEKPGTFWTWEARPRPFAQALTSTALPDHRVLHALAGRLGTDLGLGSLAEVHTELGALAAWSGARAEAPHVAYPEPPAPREGQAVLATWHLLLDAGRCQDGEGFLAGTAPRPVARLSGDLAARIGVGDGDPVTVSTEHGGDHPARRGHRDARRCGVAPGRLARLGRAHDPAGRRGCRGRRGGGDDGRRAGMSPTMVLPMAAAPAGADFSNDTWWIVLIKAVGIIVFLLLSVLFAIWFERKVVARMQVRPGPNVHGPFGLLQSLADAMKLLLKEDMIVRAADKVIYLVAPMISVFASLLVFAVIPIGPEVNLFGIITPLQLTDFPVAVLYILAAASVGVYGIVLGGWASGSTYPLLGAVRSTAQVISYELAMGMSLVSVFIMTGSMSTRQIVDAQVPIWWALPLLPAFAIYLISMAGEVNRLPFDLPEAEGELVGGYMTEYSSMKFAWFFLAEYINMLNVSAVATTLFFGGFHAPWPGDFLNTGWWGVGWFGLKLWFFMFLFVWVRGTLLRFRYDQFMRFGWKVLIPFALVWIVAVSVVQGVRQFTDLNLTGVLGVVFGLALVVFVAVWIADAAAERRRGGEAEEPAGPPGPFDAFADGYPVPPLPGQVLPPSPRRRQTVEATAVAVATPETDETTAEEGDRG